MSVCIHRHQDGPPPPIPSHPLHTRTTFSLCIELTTYSYLWVTHFPFCYASNFLNNLNKKVGYSTSTNTIYIYSHFPSQATKL